MYWYFITTYYCPVCGKEEEIRERKSGKKPRKMWQRHQWIERYDFCDQ